MTKVVCDGCGKEEVRYSNTPDNLLKHILQDVWHLFAIPCATHRVDRVDKFYINGHRYELDRHGVICGNWHVYNRKD